MRTSLRAPRHVVTGIAAASAAAILAAPAAGQSSAAPDTTTAPAVSDSENDLQLTAAQKAELDKQAAHTLRSSKPGGKRIAPDKIAWDDGDVVLTLAVDGEARDSARAADGHVRLYDSINWGGDKLEFYKCRFEKLRWYNFTNKTSSWRNSQYGGEWSNLHYWTGSKVRELDLTIAPESRSFRGGISNLNNRADFLEVCAT